MVSYKPSKPIATIEPTNDTLSGRGGLALFVRYLSGICIYPILQKYFGFLRNSDKGLPIWNLFMQGMAVPNGSVACIPLYTSGLRNLGTNWSKSMCARTFYGSLPDGFR